MIVRTADAREVAALRDLARAAYEVYVARIGRPPAPMTADYRQAVASGHVWIAEGDSGDLVGLLVLEYAADHVLLDNVAVAPQAQGTGVGSRLLQLAEEQARLHGLGQVRLYTNEAMHENLGYYARRGYRETHRATEDGYRRVYFTKDVE